MKGIILAGGKGTRLYPATISISKQILPVYDKPMIYYPLSMLLLAGIRDILIICSCKQDMNSFVSLFGVGERLGVRIQYTIQDEPRGLADAFIVGKEFIGRNPVALVLGDNIFYGHSLTGTLEEAAQQKSGATIFGTLVSDPSNYGVVAFNKNNKVISIEEKPKNPKSHYAVPGIYFYDNQVVDFACGLTPSARGELEITDINRIYLEKNQLNVKLLGRGVAWLDSGSEERLLEAATFVRAVQHRQGVYIAAIEEIAYKKGFITLDNLRLSAEKMIQSSYGKYLMSIVQENS